MHADTISVSMFLDRLRAQTASKHKNLESLPISSLLVSAEITRAGYATYLSLMADVIHDTETILFPIAQSVITDLSERKKLSSIEADLEFLDHRFTHYKTVFPEAAQKSLPFTLGMLYVVEGSTLGGRYILKNIESALGFDASNGARYFAGYGNTTGSHWKNFLSMLTAFENETGSGDTIISGANFAFDAIHAHLSNHGL